MTIGSFIREWRAYLRFRGLPPNEKSIVFYAEDAGSWRFLEPIIAHLTFTHGRSISYITSSHVDPILEQTDERIRTFCIGFGTARTILFLSLKADVMVMTMPDLGTYQIKRSYNPVRYLYVYHSINSTHMAYRRGAFDNYDQILCVGPHHTEEIRAAEELYDLEPKILLEGGYVILDSIIASAQSVITTPYDGPRRILIAPSWGDEGLIESAGPELVAVLLKAGYRVTVRPHIMTIRGRHPALPQMQERFRSDPGFQMDLDLASQGTVSESDIMISDWSGAAIEYALGLEKPVIFVDVPRKVNNPDYRDISHEPIEVVLRSEIGEVIPTDRLSEIPAAIERLCENPEIWRVRMRELRDRWIYNVGSSAEVMAAHIARAAEFESPHAEENQ